MPEQTEPKELPLLDHLKILPDAVDENKFHQFMDSRKTTLKAQGVSKEQAKVQLSATLDATRSGSIVNHRVYRAQHMRDSIPTWTQPYEKPVLTHHNSTGDAIGRVRGARFEALVPRSDWETDHLTARIGSQGSGRTLLKTVVTDPDSIDKILDGRYSTVSVGFGTDSATCSICGEDWASAGMFFAPCDHRPGKLYKIDEKSAFWTGKKTKKEYPMYLITGRINNKEVSFVNMPAQGFAMVEKAKLIGEDSSIDESDLKTIMNMMYLGDAPERNALSSLVLFDGYVDQELLVDDLVDKRVRNISVFSMPAAQDDDDDLTCGDNVDTGDGTPELYSDEEFARLHILKNLYDSGLIDLSEEEAVEIADFDDKKLTTGQRKKMSSSTFCGPNRSWPVPDCEHVRVARSFLGDPGKTKNLTASQKASVRACVNRKAKSLGCSGGKDDQDHNDGGTVMPEPKDQNTDQGNKTTVDVLTEKIETLSKTVQERDSKIADLEKQLQESQDAREKVHGELTDALVSQFVAMRRVLDGDIPEDEAKVKELVDKLKVRSVDSLRDAITDRAPKFSSKIADIQKGSITDHAGQVDDPTSQDTTPPPSKDGEGDGDGDKGKTGNKTGRDLL